MFVISMLTSIESLERPYAIRVLLLLLDKGPMNKGMIYDEFSSGSATLQDRISELAQIGLLTETKTVKRWTTRHIELTDEGREVAEHLERARTVLDRMALAGPS